MEFEVFEALPDELNIFGGDRLFKQRLDFKGVPFRCVICKQTCHLKADYSWIKERYEAHRRAFRYNFASLPAKHREVSPYEGRRADPILFAGGIRRGFSGTTSFHIGKKSQVAMKLRDRLGKGPMEPLQY